MPMTSPRRRGYRRRAMLGAVLRDRQPLLVGATKPGQLPYYSDKERSRRA